MALNRKIALGVITGAHGVRGGVRLRSFTEEPEAIVSYGPLSDADATRSFKIKLKGQVKGELIAELTGVTDRTEAERLKGTKLFVDRAKLPKIRRNEFYGADLMGLHAVTKQGEEAGEVIGLHDYGAGNVVEIASKRSGSFMLPFTDQFVPEVDLEAGHIVIDPPDGWMDPPKSRQKEEREARA